MLHESKPDARQLDKGQYVPVNGIINMINFNGTIENMHLIGWVEVVDVKHDIETGYKIHAKLFQEKDLIQAKRMELHYDTVVFDEECIDMTRCLKYLLAVSEIKQGKAVIGTFEVQSDKPIRTLSDAEELKSRLDKWDKFAQGTGGDNSRVIAFSRFED